MTVEKSDTPLTTCPDCGLAVLPAKDGYGRKVMAELERVSVVWKSTLIRGAHVVHQCPHGFSKEEG